MEFKQSQTYQNLQRATQGELVAGTKYRIFAERAREEGYEQIGNVFDETAANEQEHGKLWIKVLNQGRMTSTLGNLRNSIEEESKESTYMYQDFAKIAAQEGFPEIARLFRQVAAIEEHHKFRFETLRDNMKHNELFCKDEKMVWICLNCGNLEWSNCAPEICPVCSYPQGFYELNCENY